MNRMRGGVARTARRAHGFWPVQQVRDPEISRSSRLPATNHYAGESKWPIPLDENYDQWIRNFDKLGYDLTLCCIILRRYVNE